MVIIPSLSPCDFNGKKIVKILNSEHTEKYLQTQ